MEKTTIDSHGEIIRHAIGELFHKRTQEIIDDEIHLTMKEKYIVFTQEGGVYQGLLNIIRVYDELEEAVIFTRGSSAYYIMKVPVINASELITSPTAKD